MLNSKLNQATREGHDNVHLNLLYKHGLKVRMALTKETHELLAELYAPLLVIPGTQAPPSGMHELAAAHQSIAELSLAKYTLNHDNFIEIGPNAANFAKTAIGKTGVHGCTLRSARDQARHAKAAASNIIRGYNPNPAQNLGVQSGGLSKRQLCLDVQHLASGIPTETFCLNGWENCDFQAPIAVSNHSLYDISFRQLAIGMRNHGVHTIKAYMHFPTEILDVDRWTSYDKGYEFKRVKDSKRDEVHFRWLGDSAFGYIHDYSTWIKYLTCGGFDTPFGFSVTIEKAGRKGSQFEVNISRTTASGRFFYVIPNDMSDLIRVPNMRYLAANGFCKRNFRENDPANYIVTDGSKIRKLLDFINARAERGFTLDTVKGYARTLVSEIRLGGALAEKRWHCTSDEFSDLCISVYILSMFQRIRHRCVLNLATDHLDALGKPQGWWSSVLDVLSDIGIHVAHNHKKCKDQKILEGQSNNIFDRVALKFFEDHDCYDRVSEAKWDSEVFFNYNPNDCEPVLELKRDDIIAAKQAAEAAPGTIASITPQWAIEFGLPANMEPAVCAAYLAEEQHDILIQECDKGAAACTDQQKSLKTCLEVAALELRKRKPKDLHLENMMALTGVPGGAKTGTVLNKIIPFCAASGPVLILCPTRELAEKYTKDIPDGCLAATIHAGLRQLDKKPWSLVIVEECFTLPIAYINFIAEKHHTLLVGDPRQIQHVDFSGLWHGCMMLEAILPGIARHHINSTKRCPQDVTLLPIIKKCYPGITSESKKHNSVKYIGPREQLPETATIITFTQLEKAQLSNNLKRVVFTAHECQGMTFPSVILHYNGTRAEEMLLQKSPNHLVVALTRHTNNLFIRDCTEGQLTTFINDSTPLNLISDQSNIDLQAIRAEPLPKSVVAERVPDADIPYSFTKAEVGTAELVINKYYPAAAPRENVATTSTILPVGGDAHGVVRLSELGAEELTEVKPHKVHRFKVPQRVMVTKGHNKHLLLRTNLERLTHATKNMDPTTCRNLSKRLFDNVADEFNWELPTDFHQRTFLDAIEKMAARGHDMEKLNEAVDWKENYTNMVKSFLKAQQKPCLGKDPHTSNKAGQGISAWHKTLNVLMAPWVRALEQVLVNQSKGRVRIMSQLTDQEVMSILEQDGRPGDKFLDNDWEQFDSNQNNLTRAILQRALEKVGTPPQLLEYFLAQLTSRTICCELLSLLVNDKKDSGGPHTLIDNCLFDLAICMDLMSGWHHLYIKGDDSLARGENVVFNTERMNYYISNCGFRFKPNAAESGQFVSFIVNEQGVALDLCRVAAKVLSRGYTNVEDYRKYQEAVAGTLLPVTLHPGVNMCKVNSLHYTNKTSNEGDFDVLLSFLFRFARGEIPFSELYESEAIYYKTDAPNASSPVCRPIKHARVSAKKILSATGRAVVNALS